MNACELCGIPSDDLTFHHLIPRTLHSNKWFKQRYSKEELNDGVMLDKDCHYHIHKTHDNKYLAKNLNSLELFKNDEKIKNYVSWKQKRYNKHA